MEILSNVHIINSVVDGRHLNVYFLAGENGLIIDSGFSYTAEEVIMPYLDDMAYSLTNIKWLVNTHASPDHYGGNSFLKSSLSEIKIVAHELDAPSLSEHATFVDEHINIVPGNMVSYPKIKDDEFLTLHGKETPVDCMVQGGETLTLDTNWEVHLIHSPGHTPGHLVVYDAKNDIVFSGDALMGLGILDIEKKVVMPPHYMNVESYRKTIDMVRKLNPKYLLATHYPPIIYPQVNQFLDECEQFTRETTSNLLDIIRHHSSPICLSELVDRMHKEVGVPDAEYQYALLILSHLKDLEDKGMIVQTQQESFWSN